MICDSSRNRLIENMKSRARQFGYELKYIKEQQPVMEVAGFPPTLE